jgi:GT2 family glycosyltransferase
VRRIGPFDPAVGTGTALGGCGDEVDFFLRALDAGLAIQYAPAAKVYHHQSADPAVLERRMWNYYYGIAALMRRKYARHPVARPMMALRLVHAAALLAAHAVLCRRDLVRGDLCALRGTWQGWFGAAA